MSDPDELNALGKRIEEARRQAEPRRSGAPPTPLGLAGRFMTELVVAVAAGVGLGLLLGHYFGHKAIFLIVMLVLGAAAGILNIMRAAREINARMTGGSTSTRKDDQES